MTLSNLLDLSVSDALTLVTILIAYSGGLVALIGYFMKWRQDQARSLLDAQHKQMLAEERTRASKSAEYAVSEIKSEMLRRANESRQELKVHEERITGLEETKRELSVVNQDLLDRLHNAQGSGAAASAKLAEIDQELAGLMREVHAKGGSVYTPLRVAPGQRTEHLIFVSILPLDEQRLKIRKLRIRIDSSDAGVCFQRSQPGYLRVSDSDTHDSKTDAKSGYMPKHLLNVPLVSGGRTIGVLQFIDKDAPSGIGQDGFTDADMNRMVERSERLSTLLQELLWLPGGYDILGHQLDDPAGQATILFFDLTNSSHLFKNLEVSTAVYRINEFLTEMCDVGFAKRATIDKYMGDGAMLRFNVPQPMDGHELVAVDTALEMVARFTRMKAKWLATSTALANIHLRIGIASGEVRQLIIGHPQYQYVTVFGRAVNIASSLCENATRGTNTICISDVIREAVGDRYPVEELPAERFPKVAVYKRRAFQLHVNADLTRQGNVAEARVV